MSSRVPYLLAVLVSACGPAVTTTSAPDGATPVQLPPPLDGGDASPDAGRLDAAAADAAVDAGPASEADAGVPVDAGPSPEPPPFPRTPTPDPGPPRQVACGGCTAGAQRCLGPFTREVCASVDGCLQWQPESACGDGAYCQRDGTCGADNPCGRVNDVEVCDARGALRACLDVEGDKIMSAARFCDVDQPPPHCDARAELGVISFSKMGVGSCVQVNNRFGEFREDGTQIGLMPFTECGPCSWHQCVLDPATGQAHLQCRSSFMGTPIDWTQIPREISPPVEDLGYACSPLQGKPVQSNSKIKRGGSHPWMVASHFQGAGCPVRRGWR